MPAAPTTKTHIVQSATEVLKHVGTEGLTMRKVAAHAEMSLGNLQYHYPDKAALMAGLAEHYFEECAGLLDDYRHEPRNGSNEEQLHRFIAFLLDHVDHLSDMCRIFREMWALSARDSEIHRQLMDYYRLTFEKFSALLAAASDRQEDADAMASLLLPYIEGYSIAGEALPQEKSETARMLTTLCGTIAQGAQLEGPGDP